MNLADVKDTLAARTSELENRITEAKEKLIQAQADFRAAGETYGSELAGDEVSKRLQAEIAERERLLVLLKRCQSGALDISDEHFDEVSHERDLLQSEIDRHDVVLCDIDTVRKVLNSKQ